MSRFNEKNILFDFDGTLMDTSRGVFNSFDHVCDSFGIERKGAAFYSRLIGPPLMDSFTNAFGFSEEDAKKAMLYYREYYTPKGIFEVEVYEGLPELLQKLKSAGKKLFVATSKPEVFARQLLEHFSLLDYFDFAGGSDLEETRVAKSDVIEYVLAQGGIKDKNDCLMIGDRKFDVEGAKACGLKTLGILWGFGSEEELLSSGAVALAKNPSQLGELLLKA